MVVYINRAGNESGQPTPRREGGGRGLRDAPIMDPAAVGSTQKEDREQGLDEQAICNGVAD